ncbi:hypothetical protein BAUCODRAFT_121460 [Baudoinia panamericana UAMH 10762]|uniref:Uncharacterized protein n=1 Tax=Baudoinia panamericana (strain UAMH 10762) TaxID=717646 RepID=M2LR54_BAUPA|nr:uncharacterized protein BAUCODRAFT_121460 [Baudoinia panamericana UAMH 10762]EMC96917.1 hypothetical protein BAUCODRAFT_121460 [Baudoinia panamericana UAMH 10762]
MSASTTIRMVHANCFAVGRKTLEAPKPKVSHDAFSIRFVLCLTLTPILALGYMSVLAQ